MALIDLIVLLILGLYAAYLASSVWAGQDARYTLIPPIAALIAMAVASIDGATALADTIGEYFLLVLCGSAILWMIDGIRRSPSRLGPPDARDIG